MSRKELLVVSVLSIGLVLVILTLVPFNIPIKNIEFLSVNAVSNSTANEELKVTVYGKATLVQKRTIVKLPFKASCTGEMGWLAKAFSNNQVVYSTKGISNIEFGKVNIVVQGNNIKDVHFEGFPTSSGYAYTSLVLNFTVVPAPSTGNECVKIKTLTGLTGDSQTRPIELGRPITVFSGVTIELMNLWHEFTGRYPETLDTLVLKEVELHFTIKATGVVTGNVYEVKNCKLQMLVDSKQVDEIELIFYNEKLSAPDTINIEISFSSFVLWKTAVTIALVLMAIVLLLLIYRNGMLRR